MNKTLKGYVLGLLTASILTGGVALAKSYTDYINVIYDNIKVYKDNVLCELKDGNGSVIEPFIYNGTTYMPVRGTANLADMEVTWDGNTKSVYLWDTLVPSGTSFVEVCPPYAGDYSLYKASNNRSFLMAGTKYSDGITLGWDDYALFNLNSKYQMLECTVGHTEYHDDYETTVSFIVDGKVIKTVELEKEEMPKTVSIPLTYGLQLKIACDSYAGIGNMTVK